MNLIDRIAESKTLSVRHAHDSVIYTDNTLLARLVRAVGAWFGRWV